MQETGARPSACSISLQCMHAAKSGAASRDGQVMGQKASGSAGPGDASKKT